MSDAILYVAVLIVSVVVHENAHGWVAFALGDMTAKRAGRLTLNPVKHLDPVGSLILPAFLALTRAPVFGYAKPVPIDPRQLRGKDRAGFALVAVAGPMSNLALAFLAVVLARALFVGGAGFGDPGFGLQVLEAAVSVNLLLAAFNLIPLPPLDGSRLLRLFLRPKGVQALDRIEPYGFVILLAIMFLLPGPLFRLVSIIQSGLVRLLPL